MSQQKMIDKKNERKMSELEIMIQGMHQIIREKSSEVEEKDAEIDKMEKTIDILRMKIEGLESKKSHLETQNTKKQMRLINKNALLENSQMSINQLVDENNQLKVEIASLFKINEDLKQKNIDTRNKLLRMSKELNNMEPLAANFGELQSTLNLVVQNFDLHRNLYLKKTVEISNRIKLLHKKKEKHMRFEYDKGMSGCGIYSKLGNIFRDLVDSLALLSKKCNEIMEFENIGKFL